MTHEELVECLMHVTVNMFLLQPRNLDLLSSFLRLAALRIMNETRAENSTLGHLRTERNNSIILMIGSGSSDTALCMMWKTT